MVVVRRSHELFRGVDVTKTTETRRCCYILIVHDDMLTKAVLYAYILVLASRVIHAFLSHVE